MWLALRRVEICSGEMGGTGVRWLRAAERAQVRGWVCIVRGMGWVLRVLFCLYFYFLGI